MGAGRGTRYRRRADFIRSWPIEGLQEEIVWREVVAGVPPFAGAIENVRHILNYAMTEMVNNAIDHSARLRRTSRRVDAPLAVV